MRAARWTTGLVRRRPGQLAVSVVTIALTVGLVAALLGFATFSHARLTVRAAAAVPVDWQVQVTATGTPSAVGRAVAAVPGVRAVQPIGLVEVAGLRSSRSDGRRATGKTYLVSLPVDYADDFPAVLRPLAGGTQGPLLLQQTAANLAARPGDRVSLRLGHGPSVAARRSLRLAGIVDMPFEDQFFQVVGLPAGAAASAPPDNVLLLPPVVFDRVTRGLAVTRQLHVGLDRVPLPADPTAAALAVQATRNRLQADLAGGALVGDNLTAALVAAGSDARYADLLFVLLGGPALALAVGVSALAAGLGAERRRRDVALLRLRGASPATLLGLTATESGLVAACGGAAGVGLAQLALRAAVGPSTGVSQVGLGIALTGGALIAVGTQVAPVLRVVLSRSPARVAADATGAVTTRRPWPLRTGLDVLLLLAAGVAFALTARGGYQVVLAPEGVPQTQVDYGALLGPALAWPGLTLLVWRLTDAVLARVTGRWSAHGRARGAPELHAASVRRRRGTVARGATGLAVAVGLACSAAVFTRTYDAQARVDVALTVGSDVAVVEPPGASVPPSAAAALSRVTGVEAVEPLQHRLGYVGPDLQDLYGVDAATFGSVTSLQDAFVPGSTIAATLRALERAPDGVLLSAETLHDYQLHAGDLIRIRLQTGADRHYRPVDFHVVGQVSEWPTAPKDSFIVANAAYISQRTGSDAVGTFLIRTARPAETAAAVRGQLTRVGSAVDVSDIESARAVVASASGLAATDLSGLSRIELGFGLALAVACSALALAGGILERRRALVLLAALGATPRQRGRFLAAEARALVAAGLIGGVAITAVVSYLLVKLLTGIFDPPPSAVSVPWTYLTILLGLVLSVTTSVVAIVGRLAGRAGPAELREL